MWIRALNLFLSLYVKHKRIEIIWMVFLRQYIHVCMCIYWIYSELRVMRYHSAISSSASPYRISWIYINWPFITILCWYKKLKFVSNQTFKRNDPTQLSMPQNTYKSNFPYLSTLPSDAPTPRNIQSQQTHIFDKLFY